MKLLRTTVNCKMRKFFYLIQQFILYKLYYDNKFFTKNIKSSILNDELKCICFFFDNINCFAVTYKYNDFLIHYY